MRCVRSRGLAGAAGTSTCWPGRAARLWLPSCPCIPYNKPCNVPAGVCEQIGGSWALAAQGAGCCWHHLPFLHPDHGPVHSSKSPGLRSQTRSIDRPKPSPTNHLPAAPLPQPAVCFGSRASLPAQPLPRRQLGSGDTAVTMRRLWWCWLKTRFTSF